MMEWDDAVARRLSTRDLRIFLAVAQSKSMVKAAKTVGTSQPAISKAVADMERALGVSLLDRSPQGVEPTLYGRALVKCGIAVFNELKNGINEIGFLADPTAGELRIGCPDPVAAGLVKAVIDQLMRKHPRITFHIETEELYRQLRERNVELVINRMPGPTADEDFDAEILYHDTIVVVAGANSPWTRRRKVQLADLANEPWVLAKPDAPTWLKLINAFQASGLKPPRVAVTTGSYYARFSLLATGLFLSVRPSLALKFQGKQPLIKALPIELPMTLAPIAIITLKNRALSPLARLFIAHTRAVAKSTAKSGEKST
jgi:DNA-binding transcriptional LysR family regulator